jgi:hypothetical protein
MAIQFHNGKILFVNGAIAMDPACCCCCECYDCDYPKNLVGTSVSLTIRRIICQFTDSGCTTWYAKWVQIGTATMTPDGTCDAPKWSASVSVETWRAESPSPPVACDCEQIGTYHSTVSRQISVARDCETGLWSITAPEPWNSNPVTIDSIEGDCDGFTIEDPAIFPGFECAYSEDGAGWSGYVTYAVCVTAVVNRTDECMAV